MTGTFAAGRGLSLMTGAFTAGRWAVPDDWDIRCWYGGCP